MEMSLILLPAILASVFVSLTVSDDLVSTIDRQTPSSCSDQRNHNYLACEVEEAKLQIARLQSILDERIEEINAKNKYFRHCEKKIEELSAQIDRLESTLSTFKLDYSSANRKLKALEEEVRLLWAASRKNNFEIHSLEYKALDAERRLKEVTSQVGEMAEVVSEQWIQIQQLEQAVHTAEMRISKMRREFWKRCPFVKFFVTVIGDCLKTLKGILGPYVPKDVSMLGFRKSQALQMFAVAKKYHHQLQGFVKNAMKSNELTAALAHEEVVFFVASALIVFPLVTACLLLQSQFG